MSTIINFSKLIINTFVIFVLNQIDNVTQDFYFIYYKIDYFIVNYFNNLLKNV